MARLARRLRRSKTIDGGKTSETTGFREVDGALCRAGAGRAVAAPGLSTIGSVQRVGVGAPTPHPALLRNATFSRAREKGRIGRHCEERSDEAIHSAAEPWMASLRSP
jgi:hypothetical protein